MEYKKLKEKVKNLGFRVTKDVKGKRVKLSKKELMAKLPKKTKGEPSLENQAKSAKKFIKVCKMVLKEAEPTQPKAPRQAVRTSPRRMAPPPPPPPRPMSLNPRAALMADLKANLKKRGLANN
jgi:ParB-like chromosome segregation protein Spo0J